LPRLTPRSNPRERGDRGHQARDRSDQAAAPIRQAATAELHYILEATEKATSDILQAAEEIQEVAWISPERGTDMALCDQIDQRATDIYTACSFQDITGQLTGKVVKALRFIEQRINTMIEIWAVDDIATKMQAFADTVRDTHCCTVPRRRRGAEARRRRQHDERVRYESPSRGLAAAGSLRESAVRAPGATDLRRTLPGQAGYAFRLAGFLPWNQSLMENAATIVSPS
jgi:hypothetical protein